MAPIAASSQSRSKLKAFQYQEKGTTPETTTMEADKENAHYQPEEAEQKMIPPPQPLSQKSATKDSRDCPQTPVGRLPLSELLASGEDTSRQHLNLTPIERVLWENTPMSSTSPASRRKRKRAHSTSPASSSQNETSAHFTGTKSAVDLHRLQQNLKTPKADPADDLWSRYSLNTDTIERRSPTAPTRLGHPHLMHSSSPQTPASHLGREGAGLRRALSCIEWPTSMAKRRKLHHSSSQGASAKHDEPNDSIERSKMSRTAVASKNDISKPLVLSAEEIADLERDAASSDFGDDDLDLEMLEHVDTTIETASTTRDGVAKVDSGKSSTVLEVTSAVPIETPNLPPMTTEIGHKFSDVSFPSNVSSSTVHATVPLRDEFDDDDEDVSAADLEAVFEKYDSQLPRPDSKGLEWRNDRDSQRESRSSIDKSLKTNTVYKFPQAVRVEVLSDDDEFGDDSDFEHIAAECAEATQKQQVSQPQFSIELAIAVEHLKARVVELQAWAEIFISARPKSTAVVRDRNGASLLMSVNKLLEVEEKVWSPLYGLKGNVDATVQVLLKDGNDEKTLTVPFELKTGKHQSAAHKAQTSLYTLLLSDRYDVEIACGILYYMQTSEISCIPNIRHELVPMIMQRNELASYVRHRLDLPPMIKRPYVCGKCYAQTPCFVYHKLVDDGNGETSGLGDTFNDLVKHLNSTHQQFFSKWDGLLTKEEKDIVIFRRELWTMQSSEREKVGRCFGGLIIDQTSSEEIEGAPKINRFRYTFVKQYLKPGFSFTESQMTLGEPIVISDEKGHFALANGYVTSVRKNIIQVTVDRRLHNARIKDKNFDAERNQNFTGIMEIVENGGGQYTQTPPQLGEPVVYRLDKDEFSNGMAMIRNNLIRLMEKDVFGVQALRRLIVENVAPTFRHTASQYTLNDTASQAALNVDQRAAIEKVMSAKDYALVLGMPGTGKTTTIAHIIRALVAQGKSVLLTSYTHTAVDNILLKLRADNIGIFRLGSIAKIHPEVREFANLAGHPLVTIEEIKECYTKPIVATTCLGINHPIFNQRIFDYCIVDEASQITLPVCLGPIRMARTFILVGDHYQLPPLVQNEEAKQGGLDISLFKMLSDNHPESVVNLEHQYRMCEDIMILSNTLIYDGRLKCGTQAVAHRSVVIPSMDALKQHHHSPQSILSADPRKICASSTRGSCWLRDLLDPSVKACFVNTDALGVTSREVHESGGNRITNPCEANLTLQIVESLITTGVLPTDIGVITLYRSQLALIKQSLRHRSGVEMHTADKFQGRDKEVVVLSLVRSNENQMVGDLLKDWRRVNVALTRARTKLLVIGSRSTLVCNELLKDFIRLMEEKQWLYDLPAGACEGHIFEDGATQISARGSADAKTGSPKKAGRQVLGEGNVNRMGKRVPAKQGKLDVDALMGKRAVLRDIVNDAS
ncbi:DNA replication ATP-dependent helicase/nuclease Dna2, partial [Lecanoromycetidae sp. Uapishka_2]